MTSFRSSALPPPWRRAAVALLACLGLVLGMAAPHDLAVEQAGTAAKAEIAESAVHPGAPAHLEDAELKLHPPCLACLLQIQSGIVLSHPPAALPPLARDAGVAFRLQQLASRDLSLRGPARAPPALSPLAA